MQTLPVATTLNAEWHARPDMRLEGPLRCSHVVVKRADDDDGLAGVAEICAAHGQPMPADGARYHTATLGATTVKWELHTEVITTTVMAHGNAPTPFDDTALDHMSGGAIGDGVQLFAGTHIEVVNASNIGKKSGFAFAKDALAAESVMGGLMSDRHAEVWTSFQGGPDGFVRYVIIDHDLSEGRRARLLHRVLDIETYRLLAMQALPVARDAMARLSELEPKLEAIVALLAGKPSEQEQEELLGKITRLAAESEHLVTRSAYAFGAAKAYSAIVAERCRDVREEILDGHQRIGVFTAKSLEPAMRTCVSAETRAEALAARVERAARLLDSMVDMVQKRQNRMILKSMEKRAGLQVQLQQSVEGFSIFAISYYGVGLINYGLKALAGAGYSVLDPTLFTGLSVPLMIGASWWAVRRVKRRLVKE